MKCVNTFDLICFHLCFNLAEYKQEAPSAINVLILHVEKEEKYAIENQKKKVLAELADFFFFFFRESLKSSLMSRLGNFSSALLFFSYLTILYRGVYVTLCGSTALKNRHVLCIQTDVDSQY